MAKVIRERRQDAEIYRYLENRKNKNWFSAFNLKKIFLVVCGFGFLFSLDSALWFTFFFTSFLILSALVIKDEILKEECRGNYKNGNDFLDVYTKEMPEAYSHPEGDFGEDKVIEELNNLPNDYYHANNVKMMEKQIDHIVVCPKGVFTIETKNYSGNIFGNAEKDNWSEIFYYRYRRSWKQYSKKVLIGNPIKQARMHSACLSEYLKNKKVFDGFVRSIVVFIDNGNEIKVSSPQVPAMRPNEIIGYFANLNNSLSKNEVEKIVEAIKDLAGR